MQIRPDIYLLSGKASNFYLCIEDDQLTLIDAGMPGEEKLLFSLLEQLKRPASDLKNILITHADIDHAGSLAAIQSTTGAAVYAGEIACSYLQLGKSPKHLPKLIQWASDTFFKYKPLLKSCLHPIQDGDVLPIFGGMTAIASPGHTLGHFSFYNPATGTLFAGDAIDTRNDRLNRSRKILTADEEAANNSAVILLEIAPAIIASGHGNPLSDFSNADVLAFFNELRQEC
jgi:glyoxylase-like metal-dependent hydrolase (beta-lactamase superfamily II)